MWEKDRRPTTKDQRLKFLKVFSLWSLVFGLLIGHWSLAYADHVPGEVLVRFRPDVIGMSIQTSSAGPRAADIRASSIDALSQKFGVIKYERIFKSPLQISSTGDPRADYYKVVFSKDEDVFYVADEFKKDPNVVLAQPNYIYYAFATTPNDPYFVDGTQWYLTKVQADDAWDRTTGTSETVIAVLDTGVDYNHADLSGKVDTENMYDYYNNDSDAMDDEGHGTSVAGVIAAVTNNAIGIAGIDWNAKILPLKVLYPAGEGATGRTSDIVAAIMDAPNRGADIINMSFGMRKSQIGSGHDDELMQEAANEAYAKGCILVAAAGNDDVEEETYPAANNHVLAVAATDQNDKRSVWNISNSSNYGTWVDVCAPGSDIWTTRRGGGYLNRDGTSFSSPLTAGLAGLVKAANPSLTNQQVMEKIISSADDIDSLNPGYEGKLGSGRINAYRTISGIVAEITSPANNSYVKGGVDILGAASALDFSSYLLEALKSGALATTIETSATSVESGSLGTWETIGFDGEYTIRLKVFTNSAISEETEVVVYVNNATPEAVITSPSDGASVEGQITIIGTAEDEHYFDRYILEYGKGASPSSFERIKIRSLPSYGYESYESVDGGVLGTWETAGLEGAYSVRLTVYNKAGTSATKSISVNIQSSSPDKRAASQNSLPLTYALPNPFNRGDSGVAFNYSLEGNFDTKIYLFDIGGNLIWQGSYSAGEDGGKSGLNKPAWNGKDLFGTDVPGGIYVYQITASGSVLARGKVIVLN